MKGIFITEEGKQELEAILSELKIVGTNTNDIYVVGQIYILKEILSSATILPVEESWKVIGENTGTFYDDDAEVLHSHFKNGVIIKSKE